MISFKKKKSIMLICPIPEKNDFFMMVLCILATQHQKLKKDIIFFEY